MVAVVNNPIRLDLAQRTLRNIFVGALAGTVAPASVVWANQGQPRPSRPCLIMTPLSGPEVVGTLREEQRVRDEVTLSTVVVATVVLSQRYRIRINGVPADYTAGVGDDEDAIRDGLVVAVNASGERVTAAASVDLGKLEISPVAVGDILAVAVTPAPDITGTVAIGATTVTDQVARNRMVFSCGFFTTIGPIGSTAREIARRCTAALDTPDAVLEMRSSRTPCRAITGIIDATAPEPGGALIEDHAVFDAVVFASSRVTRAIDVIETVEIDLVVDGTTQSFTVS